METTIDNKAVFCDPAFYKNKVLPIHRWVPWIAGFSRDFVNDSINKYIEDHGMVLDPFAGVGTTLLESFLTGNDSVGFEINPYANFASQVKLNSYRVDESEFNNELERFIAFYRKNSSSNYQPESKTPIGFKTKIEFYSPKILKKVLTVMDFIGTISDEHRSDLFKLAVSSTMVKFSNYSYEPSLGTRIGSGKKNIIDYDVGKTLTDKLVEFQKDICWFKKSVLNKKVPNTK